MSESLHPYYRIDVLSPGTAAFGIVGVLERYSAIPASELANCLYRAPGTLFQRLSQEQAEMLLEKLSPSGLELEIQPQDAPFTPGVGELDLCLELQDYKQVAAVLREVTLLMGIDIQAARDLLCQSPCQLIGGVSVASAVAVERRFRPLGVKVVVINPKTALYDLFVVARAPALAQRLQQNLQALGRSASDGDLVELPVVEELDYETVHQLWEQLGRRSDAVRILARDLQRFDLILDSCPETENAKQALSQITRINAAIVPKVLARLPLAIQGGLPRSTMMQHMAALTAVGAVVHAELTAFQSFKLEISACAQPKKAAKILQWLAEIPSDRAESLVQQKPPVLIEGPFLAPRARWIQQEMVNLGGRVQLVKR